MKTEAAVKALGGLAQASRLDIYRLLVRRGPDGFNPSELSERLEIPPPTLSFHLKALQHAGLVSSRREGRFLHYYANLDQMRMLMDFMTENCCSLAENACDIDCKPLDGPVRIIKSGGR